MRRIFAVLLLVAIFSVPMSAHALDEFRTEQMARQHCPSDTVVWLNLPTMIWHYKGQHWFGKTKHGAYVCEEEAVAAGARATRNGE
jgi:hypothetical protein